MDYSKMSAEDVAKAVQDGDATAFRVLVERFQGRIYAHIYQMIGDLAIARDLTQEAFVKAYRDIGSFRREASFTTWFYRIASNVTIDHLRRHRRVRASELDLQPLSRDQGDEVWDPDHLRRTPAKDVERAALYTRIMEAMQRLSDDQRQVILLREIEGFTYREIAETMGIKEGDVMRRLFYARKKLRELLADECE